MSGGLDNDPDMISPALSSRLKLLAGIRPPKALRDRLVAKIPPTTAVGRKTTWHRPRMAGWVGAGVAAAMVLVAAFWLLPLTGRSVPSVADINDRSATVATADANFPHVQQDSIRDNNAL